MQAVLVRRFRLWGSQPAPRASKNSPPAAQQRAPSTVVLSFCHLRCACWVQHSAYGGGAARGHVGEAAVRDGTAGVWIPVGGGSPAGALLPVVLGSAALAAGAELGLQINPISSSNRIGIPRLRESKAPLPVLHALASGKLALWRHAMELD